MQQKSNDKHKDQNNQQDQITTPPISSPDSNPPSYQDIQYITCASEGKKVDNVLVNTCHKDEWTETKDETTVPLLDKVQNNR